MTVAESETRPLPEPRPLRWSREDYDRLVENGFFRDRRVELIDGEIIEMSPQLEPHAAALIRTQYVLQRIFGDGFIVRVQLPLVIGQHSDPEPDLAVVAGDPLAKSIPHPTTALLIVEIADTTLRHDRTTKASLYAAAGVADYWILNLRENVMEIHRDPVPDAQARFGHRYSAISTVPPEGKIAPLAAPQSVISIATLLA